MAPALKKPEISDTVAALAPNEAHVFVPYSELLHPMHQRLVAEWEGQGLAIAPRPAPAARLAVIFYAAIAAWAVTWLLGLSIAALI